MNRLLAILTTTFALMGFVRLSGAEDLGDHSHRLARLVKFDALEKHLGDPGLRLLDARPRADYEKSHIPGAVWVDLHAAETLAASPGGLTDRSAWEKWLAPLGIDQGIEALGYDGGRQLDAARIWWLLTYLGVDSVGLIDGDYPLWLRQGRPTTTEVLKVEPHSFPVHFRANRHATREEVLQAVKGHQVSVIDARSAEEFAGIDLRSERGGHVPSACHLEWTELVNQNGQFLDEGELNAKLAERGIQHGQPVITHCQGGGRASVDAFVLERLGYPVHNYYLGWSDWGNADETPIERGLDGSESPRVEPDSGQP